jgi:hypothetical protein
MRKPCSILLLCVLLGFGASVFLPAEDVPETAYDESELLPYESLPVFSIAASETVAQAPAVRTRASQPFCGFPRRPGAQRPERGTFWAYPISASFTILNHTLRC